MNIPIFFNLLLVYGVCGFFNEEDNEAEYVEQLPTEGDIGVVNVMLDDDNTTHPIDRSDEEWVMPAVLDVAYYLRAHKFHDFDRRFYRQPGGEHTLQYQHFPSPPLMYLHWEVNKYCDNGFYDCLSYLQDTVLKSVLVRSLDTNVIMNERHWEYPRNAKSIEAVDKECRRLWQIDWKDADPFKGPLERFQWRVSASYYMCSFAMQDLPPLMMFGERCDNYAACLDGKEPFNRDPRADNTRPYMCAIYSFCPEVCCPLKQIKDYDECLDYDKNPCYWVTDRSNRQCVFHRNENRELAGMAMNMWNLTCHCESGFQWMSMYSACVDLDECSTGLHTCSPVTETCLNLKGHYACVCAWGYLNVTGTCVPNTLLTTALSRLHQFHFPPNAEPPQPFSLYKAIFNWTVTFIFDRFRQSSINELINVTTESNNLIDFDFE